VYSYKGVEESVAPAPTCVDLRRENLVLKSSLITKERVHEGFAGSELDRPMVTHVIDRVILTA
jgi:hypothetical protein